MKQEKGKKNGLSSAYHILTNFFRKYKKTALTTLCCILTIGAEGREIRISAPSKKIAQLEIVKANSKPVVDFAAKELQEILGRAIGQKPNVVTRPTPGYFSIVLGDGELSRQAGLDVSQLPEEGFFIRRAGSKLFIAGRDSDSMTPVKSGYSMSYPRATLTGVYDFLERFAGVRFFFPGPYGTVIPSRAALFLPEVIDITEGPDMYCRTFSLYRNNDDFYGQYDLITLRRTLLPRLRESEKSYPFGHGLVGLNLLRRFGKTHPEYFALMENGKRYNDPKMNHPGQLCFSSGVREEIIQDAIAYFSGKSPETRGMKIWHYMTVQNDIFGVMPQDAMYWCRCEKCKKIWDGKGSISDEKACKAISQFMFRFFAEICQRLEKAGLKHQLATMAYLPYNIAPDFPLPPELLIQVAVHGLGGTDKNSLADTARLKMWHDRTGSKVTAWTYAMGKHMTKAIPGVPAMMPCHAANFLKDNRKYLSGVYFESETDVFLFNYLNYYVVMKLMWDNSLDVEELLADHFRAMFGKGAPFMEKFYADLEKNWTERILGNIVETDLGPKTKVPSTRIVWEKIYSSEKLKRYNALFDQALAATRQDKESTSRLRFIRKELLGKIIREAEKYRKMQQSMDSWTARVPGSIWLRSYDRETNDVNTKVSLRKENDSLVIRAECEEPRMREIAANAKKRDDLGIFLDSSFEILLNPSADRKNYFQFGVNANGALADARCKVNSKPDFSWNSGAAAKAGKEAGSWWAEVRIPLKDLGKMDPKGFPANFGRNRALVTEPLKSPWSIWSIGSNRGGFHAADSWGKICFDPAPPSLIPNGNFEKINAADRKPENWKYYKNPGLTFIKDEKCFISGGRSIRIESDGTSSGALACEIPGMKPNRKYRLSFFIKTEQLKGEIGAGAWIYFFQGLHSGQPFPSARLLGDNPWHRLSFEFTSPEKTGEKRVPILGLWVWKAKGKVWFDNVEIVEISPKKAR